MSTVSPNSLLFVALDVIARNYQTLCHKALEEISTDNGNNIVYYKMVFEDNLSLPPCISEILLRKLLDIQNNIINSDILSLFVDPEVCSLRRLRVGNVLRNESDSNLELFIKLVLKRQELVELDLNSLLEDFDTNYSGSKTAVSLEHLSLSPVINSFALDFILTFNNLKYLDVSDSGIISDKEVGLLASSLYSLESLDLSSTSVESVEVFGVLRMKLKLLSLHDTPLIFRDLPGLLQFTNLEFLDISQSTQVIGTNDLQQNLLKQFLFGSNVLQSLSSLDISGVGEVDDKAMVYFLDSHQNLKFVGLLNVEQTVSNFIPENVEHNSYSNHVISLMKRKYLSGSSKRKQKELRLQNELKGWRTLEQLNWGKAFLPPESKTPNEEDEDVLMEAREGVLEDKDQAENNNSSVDLMVINKTSSDVTIPHGSGSDENSNFEVTVSSKIQGQP